MIRSTPRILAITLFCFSCSLTAAAQQVHVATPVVNLNDSFYEWFGIDWGFHHRGPNSNFFFNCGSSQGTIPPFGGFDPSTAARLGFSHQGSNHGFSFNLTAGQGSNRTITSSAASVTLSNGTIGSVRDVQMRPFVIGLIPVVGSISGERVPPPTLISPLKERLERLKAQSGPVPGQPAQPAAAPPAPPANPADAGDVTELKLGAPAAPATLTLGGSTSSAASSATRGDISVAEIRRRQAARAEREAAALDQLVEEARAAEAVGRFGAARVRYRQAIARATGELRRELLKKFESIRDR